MTDKEDKFPKRPDKTIIIARRKKLGKSNLEVLISDDGELRWMRKTHASRLYKKTVERFDGVKKDDWIVVVVPGRNQARVLNKVVLTDGPERFITQFSDDDYERATQMLVFILNEVFQPSSWLDLPEEGS